MTLNTTKTIQKFDLLEIMSNDLKISARDLRGILKVLKFRKFLTSLTVDGKRYYQFEENSIRRFICNQEYQSANE